jgi:hypothetical protein
MQVKTKELKSIAKVQPPPSEATRKLCAARLITLLEKAGKVLRKGELPRKKQEAARKLPGPPKLAAETLADATAEPSKTEPPKTQPEGVQHERRGENALLRDISEYVSAMKNTKVWFLPPSWSTPSGYSSLPVGFKVPKVIGKLF